MISGGDGKLQYSFTDNFLPGDSIDVAIKQAAIDQDDLERRLAETTTEEPDFQTFQTTFDPPGITVKQSLGEYYFPYIILSPMFRE